MKVLNLWKNLDPPAVTPLGPGFNTTVVDKDAASIFAHPLVPEYLLEVLIDDLTEDLIAIIHPPKLAAFRLLPRRKTGALGAWA